MAKISRPYQKYIILSTYRSGTNYLTSLLNSHPLILSHHEYFRPDYFDSFTVVNPLRRKFLWFLREVSPELFLKTQVFKKYPSFIKAVGFELFYTHNEKWMAKKIWDITRLQGDLKVIHLKRNNLLRTYASMAVANKTRLWATTDFSKKPHAMVVISTGKLTNFFERITESREYYEKFFSSHETVTITYEGLLKNKAKETSKILNFLSLPQYKLSSPLIRLNDRRLSEVIKNYKELKHSFLKTRWAKFFDE